MAHSTPSILEEEENLDDDQYDYDRLQFDVAGRTDSSLIKNQNEQYLQITTTKT